MPRKPLNLEKPVLVEEGRDALAAPSRKPPKRKLARRPKGPRQTTARVSRENRPLPRMPSIMRIRRLIMAALRVWELKQGIHETRWLDFERHDELLYPIDDL